MNIPVGSVMRKNPIGSLGRLLNGWGLSLIRFECRLLLKKNVKLKSALLSLINDYPKLRVRNVASVCGFVISLTVALGPVARLFTRQMYFFIQMRDLWNDVLPAPEGVLDELRFWSNHVEAFNGYPINRPLSSSATLTCDASGSGYGAHLAIGHVRHFCSGVWNAFERVHSSTYRELMAVYLALKSFVNFLENAKVMIFSDNENVVRIIHCGSSVAPLQRVALDVFIFFFF